MNTVYPNDLFHWTSKYGGMIASDVKNLKELEDEIRRLKRIYADFSLQNERLKNFIKKVLSPAEKRKLVYHARDEYGLNISSICSAIRVSCSIYCHDTYVSTGDAVIAEVQTDFDH